MNNRIMIRAICDLAILVLVVTMAINDIQYGYNHRDTESLLQGIALVVLATMQLMLIVEGYYIRFMRNTNIDQAAIYV